MRMDAIAPCISHSSRVSSAWLHEAHGADNVRRGVRDAARRSVTAQARADRGVLVRLAGSGSEPRNSGWADTRHAHPSA